MSELPFTVDQFLQVFEDYNLFMWPTQVLAYLLGITILYLSVSQYHSADKHINRILGLFWFCIGAIYHISFFAEINSIAILFGTLFIMQGLVFFILSQANIQLHYGFRNDIYGIVGTLFILYSMLIYPILGFLFGHTYPKAPMYGIAPCPTAIFTFGILLWTKAKVPYWVLIIPFLWSLIGFSAALQLNIYEDIGLLVAGIIGLSMLIFRNQKYRSLSATNHLSQ